MEVSKVFTRDRVQQQSQSTSLTFQFRIVAGTSKILVSHRFLKELLGKRFKGVFALPRRKKFAGGSALGVGTECGLSFVHAAGSFRPVLGG